LAEAAPMLTKLAIIESAVGFPCTEYFRDKKENCRKYEQKILFTP
jgi:hypothetical protein